MNEEIKRSVISPGIRFFTLIGTHRGKGVERIRHYFVKSARKSTSRAVSFSHISLWGHIERTLCVYRLFFRRTKESHYGRHQPRSQSTRFDKFTRNSTVVWMRSHDPVNEEEGMTKYKSNYTFFTPFDRFYA